MKLKKWSENAMNIYKSLYFDTNETEPEQTHDRVAKFISNGNEDLYNTFYKMLNDNAFRPNTPCMINSRITDHEFETHDKNLLACFVLGLDDSMKSIMEMWSTCATVYAGGGGTGLPLSNLRESGANISAGGQACLTGDTILYNDDDRRAIIKQERTIKELYILQATDKKRLSKIRCMIDGGIIGTNSIINIIHNGIADVYEIETKLGYKIKATKDHRFLGYDGNWYPLEQFYIGSAIAVNGRYVGTCQRCNKNRLLNGPISKFPDVCHSCSQSLFNGSNQRVQLTGPCVRCGRISKLTSQYSNNPGVCPACNSSIRKGFNLIGSEESKQTKIEQSKNHSKLMNDPIIKERMRLLNLGENNPMWKGDNANKTAARQRLNALYPELSNIKQCQRCDESNIRIEKHHKDGNPYNNDLSNIEILCVNFHQKEEAYRRSINSGDPRRIKEIIFDEIINIIYIGKEEVYDIQMAPPYHNFIANGFVSHNSGPLEYLKTVQSISETVKSGGKARRAANLVSFWYKHPDILKIIDCKLEPGFESVNVSILIDDIFMNHLEGNSNDSNYDFMIDLISPNKNKIVGQISIRDIWNRIVENAWFNGDPGLLFKTTANKVHPMPSIGEMKASNPCGEVLLPDNFCCNLGSINLNKCLELENSVYSFNWETFKKYIKYTVKFLNNVIDKTSFPNKKFEDNMKLARPIGVGLMGWADVLYKLGIRYGSDDSISLFEDICRTLTVQSFIESIELAKTSEPIKFNNEDYDNFINLLKYYGLSDSNIDDFKEYGIKNSTVTSIAPTGSISISAECSYSFEPIMALIWEKELSGRDVTLKFFNQQFKNECELRNIELDERLINDIINNKGSIQNLNFPEDMKEIFVVAHDIDFKNKVDMQAAGQRYITLGISSTCNLPNSATKEDVSSIFKYAWKKGLKGITIYRDGTRSGQPVGFGKKEQINIEPIKLPNKRPGDTVKIETPNGSLYVTANKFENKIVEIFLTMGKLGELEFLLINTLSKIISKSLQYYVPINVILEQMEEVGTTKFWFKLDDDKNHTTSAESIVDAISKVTRYHFNNEEVDGFKLIQNENIKPNKISDTYIVCPVCKKKTLSLSIGGCRGGICQNPNCGYTACG